MRLSADCRFCVGAGAEADRGALMLLTALSKTFCSLSAGLRCREPFASEVDASSRGRRALGALGTFDRALGDIGQLAFLLLPH